jgi:predicted DNA binding CopG/RHH family protein
MKVFLNASPRGAKDFGEFYQKIYDELQKLGYYHVNDEIIKLSYDEFKDQMKKGREAQVDLYNRKIKAIKSADICIYETSFHSLETGFLVNKSIEQGKPTIVLYYKEQVPYFISGIEDEKLIVKEYNDKNVKRMVKESIDVARERRDKRFNFFISPKLLEYLERASSNEGVTKSKFIRNLITDHMRRTKGDEDDEE